MKCTVKKDKVFTPVTVSITFDNPKHWFLFKTIIKKIPPWIDSAVKFNKKENYNDTIAMFKIISMELENSDET